VKKGRKLQRPLPRPDVDAIGPRAPMRLRGGCPECMGYAPEPTPIATNTQERPKNNGKGRRTKRASGFASRERLKKQREALVAQAVNHGGSGDDDGDTKAVLPEAQPPMLRGAEALLKLYCSTAHGVTIDGADKVPTGPVVFIANHWSDADGFMLFATLPRAMDEMTIVANGTIARASAPTQWLMQQLGAILTTHEGSRGSRGNTIQQAVATLHAGRSVIFFPQGAVFSPNAKHTPAHTGFAVAARAANVPIVPVFIEGSDAAWPPEASYPRPGAKVKVIVSDPIEPDAVPSVPTGASSTCPEMRNLRRFAEKTMESLLGTTS